MSEDETRVPPNVAKPDVPTSDNARRRDWSAILMLLVGATQLLVEILAWLAH